MTAPPRSSPQPNFTLAAQGSSTDDRTGLANADFAERFLRDEGIPVVGGSLRGSGGRRVQYWPTTGRALQRAVAGALVPETVRAPAPVAPPVESGALELF